MSLLARLGEGDPYNAAVQPHPDAAPAAASAPAAAGAPDATAGKPSRWAAIANQLVTVILGLAIAAMLIINVGPLVLPYHVYTVLSGSMSPTIPVGAEVVAIRTPADQLKVGDIITFQRPNHPDQLVTHRIVAVEPGAQGQQWVTRGDANGAPDQWRIPAQGSGLKYAFHVPFLGYLLAMLSSPLGRICFILAPALLLAAVLLNDMWKTPRRTPGAQASEG